MQQTLRTEARAFVIWRYAAPREWDCTIAELAEVLGLTPRAIRYVVRRKRWRHRIRRDMPSLKARHGGDTLGAFR